MVRPPAAPRGPAADGSGTRRPFAGLLDAGDLPRVLAQVSRREAEHTLHVACETRLDAQVPGLDRFEHDVDERRGLGERREGRAGRRKVERRSPGRPDADRLSHRRSEADVRADGVLGGHSRGPDLFLAGSWPARSLPGGRRELDGLAQASTPPHDRVA